MGMAATCDLGCDADGMQGPAVLVVVVSSIGLNDAWLRQWASALAANRRYRLNERKKLGNVVAVCAGQNQRKRNVLCLGQEVVFGTWSRAISRVPLRERLCFAYQDGYRQACQDLRQRHAPSSHVRPVTTQDVYP